MKILVTGATGYIGKRLIPLLLEKGHHVFALVRDKSRFDITDYQKEKYQFSIIEADLLVSVDLENIPRDLDFAYFLVHSMSGNKNSFQEKEKIIAENFRDYLDYSSINQCIYLSGIVNDDNLSTHLLSRFRTEEILQDSRVPVTVLRAAIIIGSGSASFEIIRDLAEKLPIMIAPKWINTRCQPIAIRNVMEYLTESLGVQDTYNKSFDIGGPDILTYKEMILGYAKARGINRWIITVPFFTPRLSSYWLYFVTSTSYSLATSLVDSMKNEVIVKNDDIKSIIKINPISYATSLEMALGKIKQNAIVSSWKDALISGTMPVDYMDFIQVPEEGTYNDYRKQYFEKSELSRVRRNIWEIGGSRGWYFGDKLWHLRGFMDKLFGGVGLRRGRRDSSDLSPGDPLDFWRVLVADRSKDRILLFAEMKLPGEAWLEFKICRETEDKFFIEQCATFRPRGLLGRIYWYLVLPFHFLIFPGMIKNIVKFKAHEL